MSQIAKIDRNKSEPAQEPEKTEISPESTTSDLQIEVETLEKKLHELNQRYLYLSAELENFKKRAHIEHTQARKFGWESLAQDLIEVIDNLERSLNHISNETNPGLADGLTLTLSQFKSVLEKHGIAPIDSGGKVFDPHLHEAVGQVPAKEPRGTILNEERRGYLMHGRLLRPSQVIVSSGDEKRTNSESDTEV